MFIIWGSRGLTSVLDRGEFYCPQCLDTGVPYKLKSVRSWFTLYFIPVFPIGGKTTYVECQDCKGTYKESVLDLEPPTETQLIAARLTDKLERGTSLEAGEEQLAGQGFTKDQARELVDSLAGDGVWSCAECGDHYVGSVRKCKACGRKGRK